MLIVPALTPVTMPVEAPTEAIELLLLLQVPPPVASVSVMVWPAVTVLLPEMLDGAGLTVTTLVATQAAVE